MKMKQLLIGAAIVVLFVVFGVVVMSTIPFFFALVCYFGSSTRTDCGWLSAVPQWAILGAFSGFALGVYELWTLKK
jgi:hypothetical protein